MPAAPPMLCQEQEGHPVTWAVPQKLLTEKQVVSSICNAPGR